MLTDAADWLRDEGLAVVEIAGWQTFGGDIDVEVVVSHHTAKAPGSTARAPSLGTIINGVPGVSGPLANVLQTDEGEGHDDQFLVIAAGKSNNAGVGGWLGFTGNWRTWGLEIEHDGVSVLPDRRVRQACRAQAAILRGLGLGVERHCQHHEWSTAGKIDVARDPTGGWPVDGDLWRAITHDYLTGAGAPPPPMFHLEDDPMARHVTFHEHPSGDGIAIVPGDDAKLYFWRCVGGVWGPRQPVVFANTATQVQVNPNGGVTLNRVGGVVVEAIAEGAPAAGGKPTIVKVVAPPPGQNYGAWWATALPA